MNARTARMVKRTQQHRDAAARTMDGFVRTPAGLAAELVSGHRDIGAFPRGARILEPSAGDGAIVRAILEYDRDTHVTAVEPNSERADALAALAADPAYADRVTVYRGTLEQFAEYIGSCRAPGMHDSDHVAMGEPFDAVIMNPPFGTSSRDHVWITHVRAAWELLRPGAVLVSIVPGSYDYRGDKEHRSLRIWAQSHGATFAMLPGQPFAESGTGTRAGVLTVPRPMPARTDGLPTWLYAPTAGVPVPVRGLPVTTSAGALDMPVQEYSDFSDGSRPRVLRYAGTCHTCGRCCWVHDDRHDAAAFEASTCDAAEYGHAGPSVVLCLDHAHDGDATAAALAAAAPYWTRDPDADPLADPGPVVYPMDLGAGNWATVKGVDARGWLFTLTGRVMCDPEPVADLGEAASFRDSRIAVTLRTAAGWTVELYALDDARVTVREVPADVVPAPRTEPIPDWLPLPAYGRPLATPDGPARLAEAAALADHCRAAADTARAHLPGWSPMPDSDDPADVHAALTGGAPAPGDVVTVAGWSAGTGEVRGTDTAGRVLVDHGGEVSHVPAEQVTVQTPADPAAEPFVSGWSQLTLPV